jgi:hypothetical protein
MTMIAKWEQARAAFACRRVASRKPIATPRPHGNNVYYPVR